MVQGGGRPDEIITAELRPDLVREARKSWGVENNIYQLYHRGYVAVKGGAQDCPYTFMHDMVNGRFRWPWEDEVRVVDGTCTWDGRDESGRMTSAGLYFVRWHDETGGDPHTTRIVRLGT